MATFVENFQKLDTIDPIVITDDRRRFVARIFIVEETRRRFVNGLDSDMIVKIKIALNYAVIVFIFRDISEKNFNWTIIQIKCSREKNHLI